MPKSRRSRLQSKQSSNFSSPSDEARNSSFLARKTSSNEDTRTETSKRKEIIENYNIILEKLSDASEDVIKIYEESNYENVRESGETRERGENQDTSEDSTRKNLLNLIKNQILSNKTTQNFKLLLEDFINLNDDFIYTNNENSTLKDLIEEYELEITQLKRENKKLHNEKSKSIIECNAELRLKNEEVVREKIAMEEEIEKIWKEHDLELQKQAVMVEANFAQQLNNRADTVTSSMVSLLSEDDAIFHNHTQQGSSLALPLFKKTEREIRTKTRFITVQTGSQPVKQPRLPQPQQPTNSQSSKTPKKNQNTTNKSKP